MNNFCIYTKKTASEGAHFSEGEHILPAGIGGNRKLPKGMVSDETNALFSKWETQFLRYSPIAVLRQFYGPGKRGSLTPKNATKSVVNVFTSVLDGQEDKDDIGLCYIKLGMPYIIPSLLITSQGLRIVSSFDEWESFVQRLNHCPESGFALVPYDDMPAGTALLGLHDGKWHLACSAELTIESITEIIRGIKAGSIDIRAIKEQNTQLKSNQETRFSEPLFRRVIAKIVFNFLAHSAGQDEVLRPEFDSIRNWIISEVTDEDPMTQFVKDWNQTDVDFKLPELAHGIMLFKKDDRLLGILSLYGQALSFSVQIATTYTDDFETQILVCEWLREDEYDTSTYSQANQIIKS